MPNSDFDPTVSVETLDTTPDSQADDTLLKAFAPQTTTAEETDTTSATATSRRRVRTGSWKERYLGKPWQKAAAGAGVVLLLLLIVGAVMGLYTYSVAQTLMAQAQTAQATGQLAYASFKTQNLPEADKQLKELDTQLGEVRSTYERLGFYRFVPIASSYYTDGIHGLNAAEAGLDAGLQAVEAVTPYADVLGFTGEGGFEGGTAEDRIKLMLDTLDKVTPQLDSIGEKLKTVQTELAYIDPNRYPESIRGRAIRSNIIQAQEASVTAETVLTEYRPVIERLPEIAGGRGERKKYLVLFQNNNELRPTGGFLTAYSIIYIENGKVTPEKSDDIYELDKKFTERIAIPEALGRYLTTERYFNLRDMNISPDFKESMETFYENYQSVRGEPQDIDGIIAVDTDLLTGLVKIVGPVEVPGYGTFSAETDPRCDCPQIIYELSQIITRPTPYIREDRKGILGPLMSSILAKAYSAPKAYMAPLFELGLKSVESKSLQAYFFDEANQQAIEAINAAGRMTAPENGDFFAVVDANLGGAKSNLFVTSEMEQIVSAPENGQIQKEVEITYKNSRRGDNCNLEAGLLCLNSTLRDWSRIYLPAGSKLVSAQGFTQEPKEYEENGFHVIDGFFILEPNSQATLKLTYTVPYENQDEYQLKIWKQGGVDPIPVLMEVNGNQEQIEVVGDTTYTTEF